MFCYGHDFITTHQESQKYAWRLADYFNVKLGHRANPKIQQALNEVGEYVRNRIIVLNENLKYGGEYIKIQKEGMLTNTPWDIGEIGTSLHIPLSHSISQLFYGNIWMKYDESRITYLEIDEGAGQIPSSYQKYYNFYLGSWNNTAMIQTGHSNGNATPDEQKVLANTLFYLKQLTYSRFLIDNSAQDFAAPNKVKDGYFTDSFVFVNPGDIGSLYRYYVENITSGEKSNNISSTITTGVAGYAYVIDDNPNTTNVPTKVMTKKESIYLVGIPNVNGKWIHIRTIDRAGNYSGVAHFQIKLGYTDLALRMFISGIERDGIKYTVDREPKVDVSPIKTGGTTANYTHNKLQEWVKRNDIVTYTVRIYNEGTFDAYADEVNIHLPEGLEFVYSNKNREYGWSVRGTNQVYTSFLMNSKIEKFISYDAYANKQYKNELSYIDLKLECKVKSKVGPYTILTNLAEITKCHGVDDNGKQITGIEEKDSKPSNLNVPNDIDKPNYSKNQEDDDDFEKVQIMYTDVQGKVWVDKENASPKVQNMQVKLTDLTDGSTGVTRTYGEGEYVFKNLRVDHAYTIEFEYDGQTYTKSNKTESFANENAQDRENLNKRFNEITEAGARNKDNKDSIVTFDYNTRKRGITE